jgi:hypothetical protein
MPGTAPVRTINLRIVAPRSRPTDSPRIYGRERRPPYRLRVFWARRSCLSSSRLGVRLGPRLRIRRGFIRGLVVLGSRVLNIDFGNVSGLQPVDLSFKGGAGLNLAPG